MPFISFLLWAVQGSDSCQVIKLLGEMQPCALTPPFDGRMVVLLLSALFLALYVVLAAVELSSLNIHSTSAVDFVTHVDLLSPFNSSILAVRFCIHFFVLFGLCRCLPGRHGCQHLLRSSDRFTGVAVPRDPRRRLRRRCTNSFHQVLLLRWQRPRWAALLLFSFCSNFFGNGNVMSRSSRRNQSQVIWKGRRDIADGVIA